MAPELLIALLAAAAGAALTVAFLRQRPGHDALVDRLRAELDAQRRELEGQRDASLNAAIQSVVSVAEQRLGASTQQGIAALEQRDLLVGQHLRALTGQLDQVRTLVADLDARRAAGHGELSSAISAASRATSELSHTTEALRTALASPQARGQWGERMAEDVLRTAGFKRGVNYLTQTTTPAGGRPDITFLLPGDLCLHMDVKFPLANYLAMLEAGSDGERDRTRGAFLKDVRARIRELSGRGYVDPEAGTLDCVLMFLPNDQLYGFVQEHDPALLDEALAQGVVPCSPATLFAVLAVIRQTIDTVALERTSDEILGLLAGFTKQWEKFTKQMDKLGRGLTTTQRAYDELCGTRRSQLERQLDRIDDLRRQRGVDAAGAILTLAAGPDEGDGAVEDGDAAAADDIEEAAAG